MYNIEKFWDTFVKPKELIVDESSYSNSYGRFFVEPLERGFGSTIGNSLRRVLLSSIEGAAIVAVKIDGVEHEFSSISGVVEDVPEIILNLKSIRIKIDSDDDNIEGTLSADKPGDVLASDIKLPEGVRIINGNQKIATISEGGKLNMTFLIKRGKGYEPSEYLKNKLNELPIGYIIIDADFSPIRRVTYQVTNTRVGSRADYDKLTLEIWTDGGTDPKESFLMASDILVRHFSRLGSVEVEQKEEEVKQEPKVDPIFYTPIEEMKFPERALNCFRAEGIKFVGELVQRDREQLKKIKNLGEKTLNEIEGIIESKGLTLGMKIDGWSDPTKSDD